MYEIAEYDQEPLAPTDLTAQGKHSIRYFRVCTSFAKFARPAVRDDDEYKAIIKYFGLMQEEILELRRRKSSNLNQTDGDGVQSEQGGSKTTTRKRGRKGSNNVNTSTKRRQKTRCSSQPQAKATAHEHVNQHPPVCKYQKGSQCSSNVSSYVQ